MKLTVGLVFRNEAQSLPRCLASILGAASDLDNVEIIGVDNQSTDDSVQVFASELRNFKGQVRTIRSPQNNMGLARQLIVEHSKSRWIYFTDADCELSDGVLNTLLQEGESRLLQNEKIAGVGGSNTLITEDGDRQDLFALFRKLPTGHFFSSQMRESPRWITTEHLSTCNALFLRSAIVIAGGFDRRYDKVGEDLALGLKLTSLGYKFIFGSQASVKHHISSSFHSWMKRVVKYGSAQTHLAFYEKSIWRTHRLLPIASFILGILLCAWNSSEIWAVIGIPVSINAMTSLWVCHEQKKWPEYFRLFGLLSLTQLGYALGGFLGMGRGVKQRLGELSKLTRNLNNHQMDRQREPITPLTDFKPF